MAANRLQLNAEKTKLLWGGSRYSAEAQLGSSGLSLQFGTKVIFASDHVRAVRVTISSDLSLDKHVANVCSSGFYCLCQLRRVRRSLDTDSIKTLVHAFVMSCVDYCNAVFAGSPRYITDKLQCVLNAAARLVAGSHKFDHGLSHLLHEELHWLDVPERIHYKLGVTVHRCLQNKAPEYLVDCCTPVSDIPTRRHLQSAT